MSPRTQSARVFEPFHRAQRSAATVAGLGLGLFVAKKIARAHDGDLLVESTVGEGSTFTLRLPGRQRSASGGRARRVVALRRRRIGRAAGDQHGAVAEQRRACAPRGHGEANRSRARRCCSWSVLNCAMNAVFTGGTVGGGCGRR